MAKRGNLKNPRTQRRPQRPRAFEIAAAPGVFVQLPKRIVRQHEIAALTGKHQRAAVYRVVFRLGKDLKHTRGQRYPVISLGLHPLTRNKPLCLCKIDLRP